MENKVLFYNNSSISYYCFGSGPRPVLCFHGYGEDGTSFRFLKKPLGEQYTFIAPDLPFHGQTQWKEGLNFTPANLQQIAGCLLEQNNFQPCGSSTFDFKLSLIGFSLGGRAALSLYQAQPGMVEKLVLLAPDGLKVNFWYWLAARSRAGNQLFAYTMKHPRWFFGLLKLLNKMRLVNTSIFKFVNHYIGDPRVRRGLYERWTGLRSLKPNIPHIRQLVRQHQTPVRLIYGRHDRIIRPVRGKKFQKGIETHCTVTVLPCGHQVLQEKYAEEIIYALKG